MKQLFIILFAYCAFIATAADNSGRSPFAGMNSREIIEALRADWRPEKTVTTSADISAVMAAYSILPDGSYRDYFSPVSVATISRLKATHVVALNWWDDKSDDYKLVKSDLHNLVPTISELTTKRNDYPPGEVTSATFDNGSLKVGIGLIASYETNLFEPADDLKGDIARIYMYMATVYPQQLWHNRATMLYADGYYPLLTAYGRRILLEWHRNDPVDDAERLRNQVISEAQGKPNPFVSWPDLTEYVWGSHSDETYPSTPTDPDNPVPDDPTPEPIMLKAVYSVSEDGRIDFRSPYVAAGSTWYFDGKKADGQSLSLSDKLIGRHEITYSNDKSKGKTIITVKP